MQEMHKFPNPLVLRCAHKSSGSLSKTKGRKRRNNAHSSSLRMHFFARRRRDARESAQGQRGKKGSTSREIDLKIFSLSLSLSLSQHAKSQTPSLPLFFQSIDINLLSPPFIRQQKTPPKPRQKQPKGNGEERKSERGRVRAEGFF